MKGRSRFRTRNRAWSKVFAGSGPAPFVGPLDLISSGTLAAGYGFRRLRGGWTSDLIDLRRSSDNAEDGFGYLTDGEIDAAAIATFKGGGDVYARRWYDQSGNGNHAALATTMRQPQYVAANINSLPALTNVSDGALVASLASPITTSSFWILACVTSGIGNRGYISLYNSGTASDFNSANALSLNTGTGNQANVIRNSVSAATAGSASPFLAEARYDGSNLFSATDGVESAGSAATGALNADGLVLLNRWVSSSASGFGLIGKLAELYVFSVPPSLSDRNTLRANLKARFGTA